MAELHFKSKPVHHSLLSHPAFSFSIPSITDALKWGQLIVYPWRTFCSFFSQKKKNVKNNPVFEVYPALSGYNLPTSVGPTVYKMPEEM